MANPTTKKTVNLTKISAAFNEAVAKHPKLCDQLINPKTDWLWLELMQKLENDVNAPPYYGENIFLEEFAEAMNAYQLGHKEDAVNELAQCGAVILRMMQYVEDEMEGENKNGHTGDKE